MKRLFAFILSVITVLTLSACGGKDGNTSGGSKGGLNIPDGATVYEGFGGNEKITVWVKDGKGSLVITQIEEMSADEMEEEGITGTLAAYIYVRYEFDSAEVTDNTVALRGDKVKVYQSVELKGTAADAYVKKFKESLDEAYKEGSLSKEEYDSLVASVEGKEISIEDIPSSMNADLEIINKTCYLKKTVVIDEDGINETTELEYYDNGKLKQEKIFTLVGDDPDGSSELEVTKYYTDGVTTSVWERYPLTEKDDGSFEASENPYFRVEYREDGTPAKETEWTDGKISVFTEYDALERPVEMLEYDADGNVELRTVYTYSEETATEKVYRGETLVSELYRENNGNFTEEEANGWPVVKYVEYIADGGRFEYTYYDESYYYAHDYKTITEYDADGNVVATTEYDEDGNEI